MSCNIPLAHVQSERTEDCKVVAARNTSRPMAVKERVGFATKMSFQHKVGHKYSQSEIRRVEDATKAEGSEKHTQFQLVERLCSVATAFLRCRGLEIDLDEILVQYNGLLPDK